jgi:signal peptidase I
VSDALTRLRKNRWFELVFTVVIALGLALCVQAYAVKPYRIPSGSMEPTLDVGQRVLVDRLTHRLGSSPSVGDVVVFHPPATATAQLCGSRTSGGGTQSPCAASVARQDPQTFIKRVVAVGGDTIAVVRGHVVRNGKTAHEPFAASCGGGSSCDFPKAIVAGVRLHDGRQPRPVRRQPLLGPRSSELGHRQGDRHVLAARPHRRPLGRVRPLALRPTPP